jgi:hypothetical protein
MGGFTFEKSRSTRDLPFPDKKTRLTLSPKALLFLAEYEPSKIPDISEKAIKDKSKSDGIGKLIAFWQAMWFSAQFISRLAMRLDVSLLELNTFAHCVIAFIVYFVFWWNKLLDIMEPTPIPVTDLRTKQICAAMCAVSSAGLLPCKVYSPEQPEIGAGQKRLNFFRRRKLFGRIRVEGQTLSADDSFISGDGVGVIEV